MSVSALRTTRDVTFGILVLVFCLFLLSFITPYWFHKSREATQLRVFHGLWRICDTFLEACFHLVGSNLNRTWMKWTQALMIIDLFAYAAALGFYCHWMTKPIDYLQKHGLGWAGGVATGCCILAGLINIIAVGVFGNHYHDHDLYDDPFGWSFVLACVCAGVTFLLGITALVVAFFFGKKGSRSDTTNTYIPPTEQGHAY